MAKIRILHLEDDVLFSKMIQYMLEENGMNCQVLSVENKSEFEEALGSNSFDLILSDHTLPDFDGLSALKYCRQRATQTPFIFVSGTLGEDLAIQSLQKGAADYVLKSNMSRFIPAVKRTLDVAREAQELRHAQERIRHYEFNLRALIENTSDAVFSLNVEFKVLAFNSAASLLLLKLSGNPMELGDDFLEHLFPHERAYWRAAMQRALKRERGVDQREILWRGGRAVLEISYSHIAGDHEAMGLAVFCRDVTGCNRVLEERERFFALLPDLFCILGSGGVIQQVNPAGERILGYSQAELLSRPITDFIHPEDLEIATRAFERMAQSGRVENFESRCRSADGSYRWFSWTALSQTQFDLIYAVMRDVTEWKSVEEALECGREAGRSAVRNSAPLNILVAEDNRINQMVLLCLLEKLGYNAEVAVNGKQACSLCSEKEYDLIFMDCQMPEMDGYDATREIRKIRVDAPKRPWIVAMTADALRGTKENCLAAGMDSYLSKPVMLASLREALEDARQRQAAAWKEAPGFRAGREQGGIDLGIVNRLRSEGDKGDNRSFREMIGEFLRQASEQIVDLAVHFKHREFSQLAKAAHVLKGLCANFGALGLARECDALQRYAENEEAPWIPGILTRLRQSLAQARSVYFHEAASGYENTSPESGSPSAPNGESNV